MIVWSPHAALTALAHVADCTARENETFSTYMYVYTPRGPLRPRTQIQKLKIPCDWHTTLTEGKMQAAHERPKNLVACRPRASVTMLLRSNYYVPNCIHHTLYRLIYAAYQSLGILCTFAIKSSMMDNRDFTTSYNSKIWAVCITGLVGEHDDIVCNNGM